MGVISRLAKRRREVRKDVKAAKARARAEVKAQSKAEKRREKLLARQENKLIKAESKGLKNRRKHELELAKTEYQKLKHGRFNIDNLKRYTRAARFAAPIALPIIYRAITQGRSLITSAQAKNAGVTPEQLAQFSGHGAQFKARIQGIQNSIEDMNLPAGFKRDVAERLRELSAATNNAEFMTAQQRRRAHSAINADINKVTAQIQDRLTRR